MENKNLQPRWNVVGLCVGVGGKSFLIPHVNNPLIVRAANRDAAAEAARQALWDERLTCAGGTWDAVVERVSDKIRASGRL